MNWTKLGLIFAPDPREPWMQSHACAPAPVHRYDDVFRVFFSSRDAQNRSHVGYFDVQLREPYPVLAVSKTPVLAPGSLGTFDDHGVYASSVVQKNDTHYMYTIGWNPGVRSPLFYSSIGLAVSDDGTSFRRVGSAPIMARSEHDPCLVTAPVVLREQERWRMWYVSGFRWDEHQGTPRSYYHVKYAESANGVDWTRNGHVAIDHVGPDERNIGRTWVVKDGGIYRAWYGINCGDGYRIGFAASADGLTWRRQDPRAGIERSSEGWDSEMVAHPAIVASGGRWFMFYNGNQFGKTGVGLAVADSLNFEEID